MKVAHIIPMFLTLGLLSAAVLPRVSATEANAADWNFVTIDGTEYYNLSHLCRFYKLSEAGQSKNSPHTFYCNSSFRLGVVPDSSEILLGGYRCILSYPVRKDAAGNLCISKTDVVKFIDPVLRPTYITERSELKHVIIDPGHGGMDSGNKLYGMAESAYTLLLARELETELKKRGFQVTLTRQHDRDVSDAERVQLTQGVHDAVFISLHLNGGADLTAVETYSAAPAEQGGKVLRGNRHDEANAALSFALLTHTLAHTQGRDGACRRARHSLLNTVQCPAAMVMTGCPASSAETMEQYRAKVVAGLAAGIQSYADSLHKNATIKVKDTAAPQPEPPSPELKPEPAKPAPAEANNKKKSSTSGASNNKKKSSGGNKSSSSKNKGSSSSKKSASSKNKKSSSSSSSRKKRR